jgi:hypothetical protein
MAERYAWQPKTDAQRAALDSEAELLFFGGAAGSLKTETILADAAQEYRSKSLNAMVFRSSYVEMEDIIRKSRRLYTPLGGRYNGSTHIWTFPSGATVRFGYMASDDDVWKLLGLELTYIAFDESTRHTEFQVRNAISRLRSTDPSIRKRVRLGSNPGGVGADWHMKLFLHNHCPVHQPEKSCIPGKIYHDRRWPSDGVPIPLSVAFIPGRLEDHDLLGSDYVKNLNQMSSAYAEAMAKGCWDTLEGAYFPFLNRDYIRPAEEFEIQPWYNHFIAVDYGFGQSHAAAGLFVRTPPEITKAAYIPGVRSSDLEPKGPQFPNGRVRQIGEIVVPMSPVDEFTQRIINGFIAPSGDEQRRSIVAIFLDPANFNPSYDMRQGTGGHAVSDQMDRILEPWGLSVQQANNKRGDGWQLVHRMLRDREFEFTSYSMQTFDAIRTRMIDKEKYLDIVKEKGKPEDDLADMLRYALYTWINPADKPRELQLREAIANIDRSTPEGMTSSAIRWQQAEERLDREAAPIRMGRRLGMGVRR